MVKLNDQQKKVLVIGIAILLIVIIGGGILLFGDFKKMEENNPTVDNQPVEEINPEQANNMYGTLTSECQGALVWNLAVGEKITIKNLADSNACHNDNYYSKMIGYTYNDVGVVLHVNVLKRSENNLYKIDNTFVSTYSDETINDSLDAGTTYEYVFVKVNNDYQLSSVNLMPIVSE